MGYKQYININSDVKLALGLKLFFCIFLLFFTATICSNAKAAETGDSNIFFVDPSYDSTERSEISATLKVINPNAYLFVENEYYNSLSDTLKLTFDSDLRLLAEDFQNVIYPKTIEAFGNEWKPGIDDETRITILFTKTKENIGGYFNPNDEYKKDNIINGRSNEREMIYMNITFLGNERIKSFLTHEFQHMITWYHKTKLKGVSDEIWLNEARSEYASTAIGYDDNYSTSNLKARVKTFLTNPSDSLTEWQNKIYDYSSVNLFSQYLADHFGKILFKTMINNSLAGIESIDKAFEDLNYDDETDFRNVFTSWTVANYINDTSLSLDKKYGYLNPHLAGYENFHVEPANSYILNANTTINVTTIMKDWSSECYKFNISEENDYEENDFEISFNGENSGNFSVPYVVFYKNGVKEIKEMILDDNQDSILSFSDFERNISSISIIPSSQKQNSGFGNSVKDYSFSIFVKANTSEIYPNGTLIKGTGYSVYLIENGQKRWITTAAVFISKGYDWNDIIHISDAELSFYLNGGDIEPANLKPNGTLIKGTGYSVYLIENGQKRWITTAAVFISKGYDWNDIIHISDAELSFYLNGGDIK